LGGNYTEFTYNFTSKEVSARDDVLAIDNLLRIDYSDIKNVRLLRGKTLVPGFKSYKNLYNCEYIGLTVGKDSIFTDESQTKDNQGVFYVYLIGHFGSIALHRTVSTEDKKYKLGNTPSPFPDELGKLGNTPSTFRDELDKLPSTFRDELEATFNAIDRKVTTEHPEKYVLQDAIELPGCLKIEGWNESGATKIEAGITGDVESEGTSSGFQVGPYTSSKSKSEGTVTAELDGSIADDLFTAKIKFVQVTQDGVFIDSDPVLDFDYSAIDRVMKRDMGFTIKAEGTTYSVLGYLGRQSSPSPLDSPDLEEAIAYMQKRVEEENKKASQNDTELPEKLRELKSLHEDGVITDEEFKNKKDEILDDF
jgi:hypothetical protein